MGQERLAFRRPLHAASLSPTLHTPVGSAIAAPAAEKAALARRTCNAHFGAAQPPQARRSARLFTCAAYTPYAVRTMALRQGLRAPAVKQHSARNATVARPVAVQRRPFACVAMVGAGGGGRCGRAGPQHKGRCCEAMGAGMEASGLRIPQWRLHDCPACYLLRRTPHTTPPCNVDRPFACGTCGLRWPRG